MLTQVEGYQVGDIVEYQDIYENRAEHGNDFLKFVGKKFEVIALLERDSGNQLRVKPCISVSNMQYNWYPYRVKFVSRPNEYQRMQRSFK